MKNSSQASFIFIFITVLVDVIGIGIIIPVAPTLIEQLTGEGVSEAAGYGGWLMFAFAAMQFIFSPVMGALSDRFGRRPILLLSLLGLGVDYIFHAYAPSLGWLFVGRVLAGICGASFTTAMAYIADISAPEKRAQNFGMMGVAFGVGFIIGPLLGGFLGHYGVQLPFLVAAGLTLANMLYGYFVIPESLGKENRRRFEWSRANPVGALLQLRKYPVLGELVASLTLVYLAVHAVQSNWTFFTKYMFQWSETMIGVSLAFVGILVAVVQGGLIRVILPALGTKKSVVFGLSLYGLGLLLMGFATQEWMMFAFLIPYCLGGIAGPAIQGIISSQVPSNEQGELQGALTSLMSLTSVIGPPMMTKLFSVCTKTGTALYFPGAPFILGAVLIGVSVVLSIGPLKRYKAPSVEVLEPLETPVGH